MYSAYETCTVEGCPCNHVHGVWRATGVTLVEAYLSLSRSTGYQGYIVAPHGEVGPFGPLAAEWEV